MANMLFDLASEQLENHTTFDRLEARGALRIALKTAGLEPGSLTLEELAAVFDKLMPTELEKCGLDDADALAKRVLEGIQRSAATSGHVPEASVDATFRRLGGD